MVQDFEGEPVEQWEEDAVEALTKFFEETMKKFFSSGNLRFITRIHSIIGSQIGPCTELSEQ